METGKLDEAKEVLDVYSHLVTSRRKLCIQAKSRSLSSAPCSGGASGRLVCCSCAAGLARSGNTAWLTSRASRPNRTSPISAIKHSGSARTA